MRSFVKKFIVSLLISLLVIPSISTSVKAADSFWFHQDYPEWYVKTFDTSNPTEIFGERYTAAQVEWIFYSIPAHIMTALTLGDPTLWICAFSGDIGKCTVEEVAQKFNDIMEKLNDTIEKLKNMFSFTDTDKVTTLNDSQKINTTKPTALSVFYFIYNNEMSGTGYLLRKISKITSLPEAKAQGFGYTSGGAAVQKLWQATRNISYMLLIIVTIVLALMIMFRVKISPQAVISVQSALPKIIIGIILITFSYAIAGFLIDLMYVVIGIISMIIKNAGIIKDDYSAIELFKDLTSDRNVFVLSWQYTITFLAGTFSTLFSSGFGGGLILLLLFIAVLLATLINAFKILWLMIKTYANIILSIAIAPLQILIGIVSPIGGGFGQWVRNFISNLAIYPTVGVMFFLSFFFAVQAIGGSFGTWIAPFEILPSALESTTAWDPPLTWGTNSGRFLWMLVSFAIYMSIPKVADIIKSMIEGKPFNYGSAIGEAVGTAITTGKVPLQYFASRQEVQYKSKQPGQEIPGGLQKQKQFFDILRTLGQVK
ncbi:MAG: hypothetical protein KatS3mg088_124 [Patescibacteria group bacterium]|nr:MAG: hypothetical protein KatS3mg088_124 [Patescibacteria group bacterium]